MQDHIHVKTKDIEETTGIFHFQAEGEVNFPVAKEKLRIIAEFVCKDWERRFPMDGKWKVEEGKTSFHIEKEISLPHIFLDFMPQEQDNVQVTFSYCDKEGTWHTFPESIELPGKVFEKKVSKKSFWNRLVHRAEFLLFTIGLPIWMVQGYRVMKGKKKSAYVDRELSGKKVIFYYAHGLVKHYTGYGYSVREIKTNYFARCYRKYDRKYREKKGILLLSERKPEAGSNLDCVKRELEKRQIAYEAFLDTRPIHKLPFGEIKRSAKACARAGVIVLEDFYPQIHSICLNRQTQLVQLWHACGAFKMFGLSEIGKVEHLDQDTKNHRNYRECYVSGSQMVLFYSEAFGISKTKVKPYGVPRTDVFFDPDYREKVRKRMFAMYPQLKDKKILLFAPTFRGSGNKRAYYPFEKFPLEELLDTLDEEYIVIVKNHPFVKEAMPVPKGREHRVLDLSQKENINDILFLTDLLITDYSSCIFEASLLKIPMIFYVFDLEEYMESRDIYFDFANFAPGKQAKDQDKLLALVQEINQEKDVFSKKREQFCQYFLDALDGQSTKRITDRILSLEKPLA